MPFQSWSQLRKFGSLVKEGKIKESTFKEWLSATDKSNLPERVTPKKHKSFMSFLKGNGSNKS
ncbi:MAG: hypothetical protein ACHQUA_01890 [Microgenomates group bacterium]